MCVNDVLGMWAWLPAEGTAAPQLQVYFNAFVPTVYACLAQAYAAPFAVDGEEFWCALQFVTAAKARWVGDEAARDAIMGCDDAASILEVGRGLVHFEECTWQGRRFGAAYRSIYNKFAQNPELAAVLLETQHAHLAEASEGSTTWGIAISMEEALFGVEWEGTNLLGSVLMAVRVALRNGWCSMVDTEPPTEYGGSWCATFNGSIAHMGIGVHELLRLPTARHAGAETAGAEFAPLLQHVYHVWPVALRGIDCGAGGQCACASVARALRLALKGRADTAASIRTAAVTRVVCAVDNDEPLIRGCGARDMLARMGEEDVQQWSINALAVDAEGRSAYADALMIAGMAAALRCAIITWVQAGGAVAYEPMLFMTVDEPCCCITLACYSEHHYVLLAAPGRARGSSNDTCLAEIGAQGTSAAAEGAPVSQEGGQKSGGAGAGQEARSSNSARTAAAKKDASADAYTSTAGGSVTAAQADNSSAAEAASRIELGAVALTAAQGESGRGIEPPGGAAEAARTLAASERKAGIVRERRAVRPLVAAPAVHTVENSTGSVMTLQFPPDLVHKSVRVYRDRTAPAGLQRGLAIALEQEAQQLWMVAGVTGFPQSNERVVPERQIECAMDMRGTGSTVWGHQSYNAWTLANEPPEGERASAAVSMVDMVFIFEDQQRSVAMGFLVLAGTLGPRRRVEWKYTCLRTDTRDRHYAVGAGAKLQRQVTPDEVYAFLAELGLTGAEAHKALMVYGAPLDHETGEACKELRRRLHPAPGVQGGRPAPMGRQRLRDACRVPAYEPAGTAADPMVLTAARKEGAAQGTRRAVKELATLVEEDNEVFGKCDAESSSAKRYTSYGAAVTSYGAAVQRLQRAARQRLARRAIGQGSDVRQQLTKRAWTAVPATQQLAALVACVHCGRSEGSMVCIRPGMYTCAQALPDAPCSCSWLYGSVVHAAHQQRVYKGGVIQWDREWATQPLRCVLTPEDQALGIVPVGGRTSLHAIVAASAAQEIGGPGCLLPSAVGWEPLLTPAAAHSFITVPAAATVLAARRVRQGPRVRTAFDSVYIYRLVWRELIAMVAEHDKRQNAKQRVDGISVKWEFDRSRVRVAVLQVPFKVRLEDRLMLAHQDGWEGTGVVKRVRHKAGIAEVAVLMPTAETGAATTGYSVTPAWNSTTFERMQTALRGADAEAACTSRHLMAIVIGKEAAPWSVRVRLPQGTYTPPGVKPLNAAQEAAVAGCLTRRLSLVQGPPGTAKTCTIAAIAWHAVRQGCGQLLVVAPSNTATNRVAEVLQQVGLRVVRVLPRSREADNMALATELRLEHHAREVDNDAAAAVAGLVRLQAELGLTGPDERLLREAQDAVSSAAIRRADVVCCTTMMAGDPTIAQHTFKMVIVDEAAQATEPEIMVAISNGAEWLVQVGDHKQLGPVVTLEAALRAGYGVSQFERLAGGLCEPYLLNTQYRMHPALASYAAKTFYNGRVADGVTAEQRQSCVAWPEMLTGPFYFHAVPGREYVMGTTRSRANDEEAGAVIDTVQWLSGQGVNDADIGVIATYSAQVRVISLRLGHRPEITVSTVDAYQGQEREYIIVSFVRTEGTALQFIASEQRINVAMTRARRGRVCIGQPDALRHNALLSGLVQHHAVQGALLEGKVGALTACTVLGSAGKGEKGEGTAAIAASDTLVPLPTTVMPSPPTSPPERHGRALYLPQERPMKASCNERIAKGWNWVMAEAWTLCKRTYQAVVAGRPQEPAPLDSILAGGGHSPTPSPPEIDEQRVQEAQASVAEVSQGGPDSNTSFFFPALAQSTALSRCVTPTADQRDRDPPPAPVRQVCAARATVYSPLRHMALQEAEAASPVPAAASSGWTTSATASPEPGEVDTETEAHLASTLQQTEEQVARVLAELSDPPNSPPASPMGQSGLSWTTGKLCHCEGRAEWSGCTRVAEKPRGRCGDCDNGTAECRCDCVNCSTVEENCKRRCVRCGPSAQQTAIRLFEEDDQPVRPEIRRGLLIASAGYVVSPIAHSGTDSGLFGGPRPSGQFRGVPASELEQHTSPAVRDSALASNAEIQESSDAGDQIKLATTGDGRMDSELSTPPPSPPDSMPPAFKLNDHVHELELRHVYQRCWTSANEGSSGAHGQAERVIALADKLFYEQVSKHPRWIGLAPPAPPVLGRFGQSMWCACNCVSRVRDGGGPCMVAIYWGADGRHDSYGVPLGEADTICSGCKSRSNQGYCKCDCEMCEANRPPYSEGVLVDWCQCTGGVTLNSDGQRREHAGKACSVAIY